MNKTYLTLLRFISLLLVLGLSSNGNASHEKNTICNSCSDTKVQTDAISWAKNNLSVGSRVVYTGIDLKNERTISYSVLKASSGGGRIQSNTPQASYSSQSNIISRKQSTPSHVLADANDLFAATNKLEQLVNRDQTGIPREVIRDAWEFTGCRYCEMRVQDYLRKNGEVGKQIENISRIMRVAGIFKADMPDTFEYPIDGGKGGKLLLKVTVLQSTEIQITVLKAYDIDFNEVPFNSSDLRNKPNIYVSSQDRADTINTYIINSGYVAPPPPAPSGGVVGIIECASDCSDELEELDKKKGK